MKTSGLSPGDHHYKAYVGPPEQYDFMGATQFRLLCTLGLRAGHKVLDFGCGSLRAGRFLITYLNKGCYYGVEPNKWLIEDAIKNQMGEDFVLIKKPNFDYNSNFSVGHFETRFDFIIAQSVFSHTSIDLLIQNLRNFKKSLATDGIIVATFIEGKSDFEGEGWIYPGCVRFRPSTIKRLAADEGLETVRIPWYHPRQSWYVFAADKKYLPGYSMRTYLQGAVLFDKEFVASWKNSAKLKARLLSMLRERLPEGIKTRLKKILKQQ